MTDPLPDITKALLSMAHRVRRLETDPKGGNAKEKAGITVDGRYVSQRNSSILVTIPNAEDVEFEPTSTGLEDAMDYAGSGIVVTLPPVPIDGDHTLRPGVRLLGMSRYASVLTGSIVGNDNASMENLSIITSNSVAFSAGSNTGTTYIHACDIHSSGSETINTAVDCDSYGSVELWMCDSSGSSTGGSGYAGVHHTNNPGRIYFFGGRCFGSTDTFEEV